MMLSNNALFNQRPLGYENDSMDPLYLPSERLIHPTKLYTTEKHISYQPDESFSLSAIHTKDFEGRCLLEPTPIAPNKIHVVEKIELKDALRHEDNTLIKCLSDLLPKKDFYDSCDLIDPTHININNDYDVSSDDSSIGRFRESHLEKWSQRFQDLVTFKEQHGHCLVPLEYAENPSLAHWVKRQRCQYKVKQEGKHSTLTEEREVALERLGFVWDSHRAAWEERLREIALFREIYGHCNVPSKYPENPQLAIWVKCQRRQFKLYCDGKKSNMTTERILKLNQLGFAFTPRMRKVIRNPIWTNSADVELLSTI